MIVSRIVEVLEDCEIDIKGATLLTLDEARELPQPLKEYEDSWWTRTEGYYGNMVAIMGSGGISNEVGLLVPYCAYVRPALNIRLKRSGMVIGSRFIFNGKKFEVISKNKAFCLDDIGFMAFNNADTSNNYENSAVKKFIDEWMEWDVYD